MNTFSALNGLLNLKEKVIADLDQSTGYSQLQSVNYELSAIRGAVMAGYLPLDREMDHSAYTNAVTRVPAPADANNFDYMDSYNSFESDEKEGGMSGWREEAWLLVECQKLAQRVDLPALIERHQRLIDEHKAFVADVTAKKEAAAKEAAKAQREKNAFMGLPALKGSAAQKKWANELREKAIHALTADQLANAKWSDESKTCRYWIDNRNNLGSAARRAIGG